MIFRVKIKIYSYSYRYRNVLTLSIHCVVFDFIFYFVTTHTLYWRTKAVFYFSALPDSSVDVVIAAQSFHWFANRAAVEEIHRVLAPSGSFGIIWLLEDISVPWVRDLYEFMRPMYEQNSIAFPYQELSRKSLLAGLFQQLFSAPKENLSFSHRFPSSIELAYEFFCSFSVILTGSEQTKKAFKECFDNVMEKHFKGNGIPLDHISFQIYMCWCTKTTSN